MKVYAFPRGGLSLAADRTVPSGNSSTAAFLPALSVLSLSPHPGGRIYPLVDTGDIVREGMLVGRALGEGAVNVHATVPGRVLRKVSWIDSDGLSNEGLLIRMAGAFERLGRKEEYFSWKGLSSRELLSCIADYGVAEMEGSGEPVTEKFAAFAGAGVPGTLVVRCVFDDPWLAADAALCRERLINVVEGAFIAAAAVGVIERVVFTVSAAERKLGEEMLSRAGNWNTPAFLVLVGSRYPQRNRRELGLALSGFEKKENIPLGSILIMGPATLAAVYDAVIFRRPPLERYVAVGGSAVRKPQVMKARLGKRIGELFDECGGFIDKPKRIASGMPILGKAVVDLNEPVTKTCYAVFAMLHYQAADHPERNCIGCGECRQVCPVGLDPEELYKEIMGERAEALEPAAECHGCGCCEVVCPSHLPLTTLIRGYPRGERHAR